MDPRRPPGPSPTGELGQLDFIQVLYCDEINHREAHAIARRLHRARSDQHSTLEESDITASPRLPAAQIRDLAALCWLQAGESVILFGPAGVGKSHFAQAMGHLAIRRGADVRFAKPARHSPTSPAGTPTTPGPAAYANTPGNPC